MNFKAFVAASAVAMMASGVANAITMDVTGGTMLTPDTGNYTETCTDGNRSTCYDPDGPAAPAIQDIMTFFAADTYPGLTFTPAGAAVLTVTFLGTEASADNDAVTFALGSNTLSNKENSFGDSYTVMIENLLGTVPFGFTSSIGATAGFNGFSGSGGIAFSEVFNEGRSVYAYFDDSGSNTDRDWDDMIVQIDISEVAPIPLPAAAWMLLAGIGGLVGMRRFRRTA